MNLADIQGFLVIVAGIVTCVFLGVFGWYENPSNIILNAVMSVFWFGMAWHFILLTKE
jgi:hypothetical protein